MEHVEPKHKPSPKHTLADVLGSLQDLVRNELVDHTPLEPNPSIDTTSQQRGGAKVSANDVLNSLKGLIADRDDNTPTPTEPTVVTETPAVVQQDFSIDDAEVIEVLEATSVVEDHGLDDAVAELEASSDLTTTDSIAAPESDHDEIRLELNTAENTAAETPALFTGEQLEVDFDVDLANIIVDEPPADPDAPAIMPNLDLVEDNNNEHVRMASEPPNLDDNPFLSKEEPPSADEDTITLEPANEVAGPVPSSLMTTDRSDSKADAAPPTLRLEDKVKADRVPSKAKRSKAVAVNDKGSPTVGTSTATIAKPATEPLSKATGKDSKLKTQAKGNPAQTKKVVAKETPAPLIPDVTDPEPGIKKAKKHRGKKLATKSTKAGSKEAKLKPSTEGQTELDWDDIPVLDIVAKEPPAVALTKTTANKFMDEQPPSQKSTVKNDGSEKKMRDIAIKAIAKLNIQLRKSGEAILAPIMIDRLQYVLKELLDQQGTNVDNTPQQAKKSRKSK